MEPIIHGEVEITYSSRKKWLPIYPDNPGYFTYDTRIPHPSPAFRGFYIWKRSHGPRTLQSMLVMHFIEGVRKQLRESLILGKAVSRTYIPVTSITFSKEMKLK